MFRLFHLILLNPSCGGQIALTSERSESLARRSVQGRGGDLRVEHKARAQAAIVNGLRSLLRQGSAIDGMSNCAAATAPLSSPALSRPAARLRGLTAALRPSVRHPCRSTAQCDHVMLARPPPWDLAGTVRADRGTFIIASVMKEELDTTPPRKRSVRGPVQAAARVASRGCQFQGRSSAMRVSTSAR
jgi:hypothetical protein